MLSSYLLSLHSLAIVWWISSWLAAQLSCILINKMVFTQTDSCYNRAESILRRGLQSHLLLNLLKFSNIFILLHKNNLIFPQATRRMLRMSTTTPTTTMTRSITTMTTPTPTPATRSSTPPATRRSSTRGIQSSCPR